jgi:predicted NodU family carbamoyl transferase
MKPPPRVLGFNDPWHDSNFSIYGAGSITHVEVERHTRRKYESINPILAFCEMFPNDVESFFHVAFEETDFPLGSLIKKIARLKEQQTDIDALIETLDVPYGHPEVLYSATDLLPVSNNTDSVKAFLRHLSRQDVSLYFCGHHAAHAANAYLSSSFADALVVTLDGGGTDYSPAGGWTNVDQKSFGALTHRTYGSIFECNGVECRPTFHLTEKSFGLAWYRTTTKILGLTSGEEGTVMAMAAFGDPAHFRSVVAEPWLWSFEQGNLDLPFAAKAHACIRTEQDRFDFAASLQEATESV